MPDSLIAQNAELRGRLDRLMRPVVGPGEPVDVVVTLYEINDRHGTGPLVKRVLSGGQRVFSIRARSDWGYQDFGDWSAVLPQQGLSRQQCAQNVRRVLAGYTVRNVLCVPYLADELLTSIAIHDELGADVCTWIMDDQNIASHGIPDSLIRELLEKSALRLATHPELCQAYERKFGLPFYHLPAVVPHRLILPDAGGREPGGKPPRTGALIGSFWEQAWFDRLCDALESCGAHIDWYGNNRSRWVRYPERDLVRAGITAHGIVPEEQLAAELRRQPFVIVPVGTLDGAELHPGISRLSLPGRILFVAASSNTPVLVVGNENTSGAHFVKHFGIGQVVPYDGAKLAAAMDHVSRPEAQRELRANALRIAPALSDRGVSPWLATSVRLGRPADSRFEDLFARYRAEL
jgi:hypothetical protein